MGKLEIAQEIMNNKIISSFLEKLIDWKEFEFFVADIYSESSEVIVQHDITLLGKSNAKRQIDVYITQKTKLHTYTTIVECKRWKKPVTRQVIDILFASLEDLNASKGVIFTTHGYEEGAIKYAKNKNIDIFIVRDIREDEYGNLGKTFSLYLQMLHARIENFDLQNLKWFSPLGLPLSKQPPKFDIHFAKEQIYPEHQQLVDLKLNNGPNLVKLLIDIRADLLKRRLDSFHYLLQPESDILEIGYKTRIKLDFTNYKYKFIRHDNGFIQFDSIYFDFVNCIDQSKMTFDKTESLDFALIVENYISKQRNFVSKPKTESKIKLSEPIKIDNTGINESEFLQPNSIIRLTTEHYVSFEFKKETKITETKDIVVNLINQ
ncbi:restriction endonuclease [Pedobacter sp. GR22-10]|uniref:restriction endonuclease n=1 Tax=Pedobacter sp. GR22-10 TaxID=2994472 RepID=UPI00224703B0|nr:restriction endonuclease [Pedobacter sp. GR22-10]MCX2431113.1 restriction endonuclease [Pedobacter sp. GR22-10]